MIKLEELQKWQSDWTSRDPLVIKRAVESRRALIGRSSYLEKMMLSHGIQQVRMGREAIVQRFAYGFADQIALDSSIGSTPHPLRLIELASRASPEDGLPDSQRWFEGISLFDQAVSMARIERSDPFDAIGHHLDSFIDLIAELFKEGFIKKDFYCYHDPESQFEVHSHNIGIDRHLTRPGLVRRKSSLTCREIFEGEFAYLHHRIKDPFRAWLKMQKQVRDGEHNDPFEVDDRSGLMFMVPEQKDVLELAEFIQMLVIERGGEIRESLQTNLDRDGTTDTTNPTSSKKYKIAKVGLFWNGRRIELQFMTFHNYFSSLRSLSDMNHELYKLRQSFKWVFPLLWPREVYGVDWENPQVRHQLMEWKVSQLGWRVNGDHSS